MEGTLPEWLKGDLVRTAPAVFSSGSWRANHWFDGLGLIYGFSLGPDVSFRQRLLESDTLQDVSAGRNSHMTFGTPTSRTLLHRLIHPIPSITDNANVNIVPWEDRWLALTESPHQHVIDGSDLRSRGLYRYEDKFPRFFMMSAHPHFDARNNALINVGTHLSAKSEIHICRHEPGSRKRVSEGSLSFASPPYIHSFGLSPRYAVVIEHPFHLKKAASLLFSNKEFADHFSWRPEHGTRFWTLDRTTRAWRAYEAPSLFCFHTVNQFERADELVLDLVAYDDAQIISDLVSSKIDSQGLPDLTPRLLRVRLPAHGTKAVVEPLWGARFEVPRISYQRHSGQPYTIVWGAAVRKVPGGDPWSSQLIKQDLSTGHRHTFDGDGFIFGEPVFVPKQGSTREDEGVILTVGGHATQERSALAVLDAASMEPIARAEVNVSLPFGFHGNFAARPN
jgi:carotenoid cleavage dioxygenase-like enzyme